MAKKTQTIEAMDIGETGAGIANRTGVSQAPEMALDLIREAQRTPPTSKGDARLLGEYRGSYLREKAPMGSKPLPPEGEGPGSGAVLLLDKLGERLAFERQGTRLYECLVGKVKLLGSPAGGPSVKDLEHILAEEREHFEFLQSAINEAGGDPTVLTPCANVAAVLSQGILQIVADPRATVVQSLEAVLNAELADNDGWTMLEAVAAAQGRMELVERIAEAKEHEAEHLQMVRGWLTALVVGKPPKPAAKPAGKSAPAKIAGRVPGKAKPKRPGRAR